MKGADVHIETEAYTMSPARYAKNKVAVRVLDGKDGFKGRASYLASALPSSYSHREGAYIMSKSAALRLHKLYQAGWDAGLFPATGKKRPSLVPPRVLASTLGTGDVVEKKFERGQYHVRITSEAIIEPDIFGRTMLRFEGQIIKGPDRVGARGLLTYGHEGEAYLVYRSKVVK